MAKTGKKTYYWDTATFIAWLDGGKGHPLDVLAGLDEIAQEVNENRSVLCTSVITNTEVLEGKLTPDQVLRLQNFFQAEKRRANQRRYTHLAKGVGNTKLLQPTRN